MKLGFIGTGAISEALIIGMIEHGKFDDEVFVSRRSQERSQTLASRFGNVTIVDDNQQIIEQSEWVFLAVLPEQLEEVMSGLNFLPAHTLISLVAGISIKQLKQIGSPLEKVHRIIPLPPIEHGVGPLPIYPASKELENFFDRFGTAVCVENEQHFSAFSAASAVMATHHRLTAAVAHWIFEQGVPKQAAAVYASQMLNSLTELERSVDYENLQEMAEECLTAGGLNEQVLNELEELNWFGDLAVRLDRIAARLAQQ